MSEHRNVIVVLTHGLRSDTSGGNPMWPGVAPNLQRLARRSARYVAVSACPSDWGGMVTLLTGLHARQHGYTDPTPDPPACDGWPAAVRSHGYTLYGCGLVGAVEPWLNRSLIVSPPRHGQSPACAYLVEMRRRGYLAAVLAQRRKREQAGLFDPDRLAIEPDEDIDGFIAAQARNLVAELPADKPWLLLVVFSGPANDLPPPPMYERVVEPRHLTDGFAPADFTRLDDLTELDYPRTLLQRLERPQIGRMRADYLGRVSLIDHGIGGLLKLAAQRTDASRIWTVVASDRGFLLGEHGLIGHRSFLAPAVETPVIIAPPPTLPDKERLMDQTVSTVDLSPTIAALTRVDPPPGCVGRSLLHAFADDPPPAPMVGRNTLSEFGRRLMLETERHKLIFDSETRTPLGLYDLLNDPEEGRNLAARFPGRNLIDSLRWRLADALMPLRALPGVGVGSAM